MVYVFTLYEALAKSLIEPTIPGETFVYYNNHNEMDCSIDPDFVVIDLGPADIINDDAFRSEYDTLIHPMMIKCSKEIYKGLSASRKLPNIILINTQMTDDPKTDLIELVNTSDYIMRIFGRNTIVKLAPNNELNGLHSIQVVHGVRPETPYVVVLSV